MVLPQASEVSIEFVSFGDQTFDAIEKGRLDLMLNADEGYLPPRFASEMIFDDSFSCVASKNTKHPKVLTLKQYLAAEHVGVGIWNELQTLPDKRLAGIRREATMPDLGSLFHCRRPLRTGHAFTRDGPKPHRTSRIEQSRVHNTQAARGPGKVQLPNGLASAHEHRCGPLMVAPRDPRDREGALFRELICKRLGRRDRHC
jgi:hypothetical protein